MLTSGATSDGPVGYDVRGAGSPVVLLHPFPFDRRIWASVSEALSPRHRVIAVDGRGFGETPLTDGGDAIAGGADDVAAVLDQLDVPRAAVLGMSMGGYAALAFAARHPGRLAALVLCDTRAGADDAKLRAARDGAIARIRETGSGPYLDGSLARLLSPSAPPARVAFLRARAETRAASLIAGIEALRDRPDRTGELAAIRCPTLVLRGTDDQVTPAEDMQAMASAIAGATFVPLDRAGHLSHIDAPGAFERALAPFLARALEGVS
ncbi:MAG TPA: alpha/beta fold hydrolase [Polyangia bacterium]|nr:alpha/beta fold hydrolase [Polyangia bacterium]